MTRRLVTYVAVAYLLAASLPVAANAANATAAKGRMHHGTHAANASSSPKIDLNTASETDLAALPGIDATTAQKIISMRPYKSSNQLVAKGIVTKEEFGKIRSRVTARHMTTDSKAPGSAEGTTK